MSIVLVKSPISSDFKISLLLKLKESNKNTFNVLLKNEKDKVVTNYFKNDNEENNE